MGSRSDQELQEEVQKLLDHHGRRLTNLQLQVEGVFRDDNIVRILVRPSRPVHSEDYVYVLAAVESDMDTSNGMTILLVPVTS